MSQMLFGTPVFDHITFIVPVKDLGVEKDMDWESTVDQIQTRISGLTGYEKEILKFNGDKLVELLFSGCCGIKAAFNYYSNVL